MCGLCGVVSGYLSEKEKKIFKELLFISSMRGRDSTGVLKIVPKYNSDTKETDLETHVLKAADPSFEFLQDAEQLKFFEGSTRALMGHTRSRTKGDATEKNAHPFEFPNVIGMHNGSIWPAFKYSSEFETDSEALFKNIDEFGPHKGISNANFMNAAFALTWYNKKDHTINMIRNEKRPLFIAKSKDEQTLFYASEKNFLQTVLERNEQALLEVDGHSYWYLAPHDLWKYDLNIAQFVKYAVKRKLNLSTPPIVTSVKYPVPETDKKVIPPYAMHHNNFRQDFPWVDGEAGYDLLDGTIDANEDVTENPPTGSCEVAEPVEKKTEVPTPAKDRTKRALELSRLEDKRRNTRGDFDSNEERRKQGKLVGSGQYRHWFRGFDSQELSRRDLQDLLNKGCTWCSVHKNVDQVHDKDGELKVEWLSPTLWICDECYSDPQVQKEISFLECDDPTTETLAKNNTNRSLN